MKNLLLIAFLLTTSLANGQSYYDIADTKSGNLVFDDQDIRGLWEVEKVEVGDEEMTPTARWFEILEGGKLFGGNGGITNTRGAWTFDQNTNKLEQLSNGQKDPYGAFDVIFSDEANRMTWSRIEEGMEVKVSLKRVTEKPLAPWDFDHWLLEK